MYVTTHIVTLSLGYDMLFLLLAVMLSELREKPGRQDRVTEKSMGATGGILCDDIMRKR